MRRPTPTSSDGSGTSSGGPSAAAPDDAGQGGALHAAPEGTDADEPAPLAVTPLDARLVQLEDRPALADRPWVVANFVSSLDGAAAGPDDRSGSLSGPADKAVFHALRAAADVVLAGAGTVRAENYGRPRLSDEQQDLRRSQGRPPLPRLAVVTRSLNLDPEARFFTEAPPEQPPIILTTSLGVTEAAERVRALEDRATIIVAGEATVDWARALRLLRDEAGAETVLTEGGPTVVGELVNADLLDEMCLTVAPLVAGGDAPRIVSGARLTSTAAHRLTRIFESEGFLLLRYLRDRPTG